MTPTVIKRIVTAIVSLILTAFFYTNPLWLFEYNFQDGIFQSPGLPHHDIFVIGIDEHTLETMGAFHTWSRSGLAEALTVLNSDPDFRPAVIAVDVLFVESANPADDKLLLEAVRTGDNILLASLFYLSTNEHILPIYELLPYITYGFINGTADADHVIRTAPLRIPLPEQAVYSFATMAASIYLGVAPSELLPHGVHQSVINYTGQPGDFFELSFSDLFEDWFDPAWFDGAIVLIGPFAMGMMDHHAVPITPEEAMFGVEIHANIIQQVLEEVFIQRAGPWLAFGITLVALALAMVIGEFSRAIVFAAPIMIVGYYFAVIQAYHSMELALPILSPIVAVAIASLYHLIYSYVLQSIEKNRLRNTFKKYVDPKLVDVLVQSKGNQANAVGEKLHIAVMFIDIRGFTPLTEQLADQPELIVEILNKYLTITSTAIFENGGSVDKFIGDATMALFNGFIPLEDYVYKAVKAAWDIVQKADAFNQELKDKYGLTVSFGIGVHCGEAIVGNLGPEFRKDYTAIGDTVNTAARLESNAKPSQVLISPAVLEHIAGRVGVSSVGEIALKGKSQPMQLSELTALEAQ